MAIDQQPAQEPALVAYSLVAPFLVVFALFFLYPLYRRSCR